MITKYKLDKLKTEITTLQKTPIAGFKPGMILTYRNALISICEMHQPTQLAKGESLRAYDIGIRFLKIEDSLELNETDMKFLKTMVFESKVFVSIVIGRVRDYLDKIVPIKVEEKKQ